MGGAHPTLRRYFLAVSAQIPLADSEHQLIGAAIRLRERCVFLLPPVRFIDLSNEAVAVTQLFALQRKITICHHEVEPSDTESQPVDRPDANESEYYQQQPSRPEWHAR